ncbi:MAG TPA: DUF5367 family protein [Caulobacteraceae bacterium]|nr:DUF5367 family protein [Caulobacteraceae bacterium]
MTLREIAIYAAAGFGVWLSGAFSFRLGGKFLFENGPVVLALSTVAIAGTVCFVLRSAMNWRKAPASAAVEVAVIMITPGLFGETARLLTFPWSTGLHVETAAPFAAVMIFSTATLLAYAVVVARKAG